MDWNKKIEDISIAQLAGVLSFFVYVTGYLISALYIRSRGINQMSLLSSQYIETGLVFFLLTALFVAVPIVIMNMALDSRTRYGYPNLLLAFVFPIVTSNFLYVFTFFCLFVTRYEWLLRFRVMGIQTGLIQCFVAYTVVLSVLQVAFMYIKYDSKKSGAGIIPDLRGANDGAILRSRPRLWTANIIILLLLVATVAFDFILFKEVRWLPMFLSRAAAYIFCTALIVVVAFVVAHLSHVYAEKSKRWKFWLVAGPLFLVLYYFAISSYEFGVYINIPMSRGGKYPITKTTLYFKPDSSHAMKGNDSLSAYVLEETTDRYYVVPTDIGNWFHDHPSVDGIDKTEVAYPHYDHLRSGEPRINHLKTKELPTTPFTPSKHEKGVKP